MDRLERIQKLVDTIASGEQVMKTSPLLGGMSAETFLVTLESGLQMVARFMGQQDGSPIEEGAVYEHRALEAVYSSGVRCPRPLALDNYPDDPFLLLEYIPGTATAAPENPEHFIEEFAKTLASIHEVDMKSQDFSFLLPTRRQFSPRRTVFNQQLREPEICQILVDAGEQNEGAEVLRHGDFWPGNILWLGGDVAGIIDWENALTGPAIADLAISRLDMFWILGREAMEMFTRLYLSFMPIGIDALPYWDLRASLRPMENLPDWADSYPALGRPDITPEHLQRILEEFIAQALEAGGYRLSDQ